MFLLRMCSEYGILYRIHVEKIPRYGRGFSLESKNEKDYMEIDLVEVFYILKKNFRNIFVVTLCCMLFAAGYVFLQPKAAATYTSEALVRVRQMPGIIQTTRSSASNRTSSGDGGFTPGAFSSSEKSQSVDNSISTAGYGPLNLNQRLLTYAEIMKSNTVLGAVNQELGSNGSVTVTPVKDTEMMKISFKANDAETAQKGNALLITAFQNYIAQKEQSENRYVVNEHGGQKSGENSAAEVIITNYVNIEIVNPPTLPAASAAASNKKRTLAVSALLGILLSSGYAVLRALMNRKITTRQDIEDYLGLPVLAIVPEENSLAEALARHNEKNVWQKIGGLLWEEQN